MLSKDPQDTINTHSPFEDLTQLREYEYTNHDFLKIENSIKISIEFHLKNGLKPVVEKLVYKISGQPTYQTVSNTLKIDNTYISSQTK